MNFYVFKCTEVRQFYAFYNFPTLSNESILVYHHYCLPDDEIQMYFVQTGSWNFLSKLFTSFV
jgi:hypothetical protein